MLCRFPRRCLPALPRKLLVLGAQRSSLCRWRCRPLMFPRSTRLVFVGVVATAVGIVVGAFVSIVVSFRVVVLVTSLLPLPIVELTCCVRCSCRRASACSWPWPFSAAPYWFCLSRCCRCVLSCGLPSPLPLFIADVFAVCAAKGGLLIIGRRGRVEVAVAVAGCFL